MSTLSTSSLVGAQRFRGRPLATFRDDQVFEARRAGARHVIGKPFEMSAFLETVRSMLFPD